MEGRGVAGYKRTARDLGAFVCFENEAGQGLRPPKGRAWAARGARPVVRVRGAGGGRVSIAGVACYRPGDRPHLYYQLRVHRRRKGEPKGFTWADYRDLIIATHRALSAPQRRPPERCACPLRPIEGSDTGTHGHSQDQRHDELRWCWSGTA